MRATTALVVGDGVEPEDTDRARGGAPVSLERLDGGGLARAVGPEQGEDLAPLGPQRQSVHRGRWPVAHDEVATLDGRQRASGEPRCGPL